MTKLKTEYLKITLSNGIKCILYPRNEIHSVSISAMINVGSLDEDAKNNGISHLLEHLTFDGTEEFDDWQKLNTFINDVSGSNNAETSDDHTKYYATLPYQYLEEGIRYVSQVSLHPIYRESDVKKEVDIILDEKTRYDDSTEFQLQFETIHTRFKDTSTSYSMDVIGTEENLRRFTSEDVLEHFSKYYTPENIEVYLVGNFDIAKATLLLEKYFGVFKNKNKVPERKFIKEYPEYSGFTIKAKQKLDIQQYYLLLNFPSLEFTLTTARERHLLSFLSVITASPQYQNSILWRKLREELGIVYDVSSWTFNMMSRALFAIDTNFNPEHLEVVLKEIYEGINLVKQGLVGEDIFEKRKKRTVDTELIRYDNPANVMGWILSQEDEQKFHGKSMSISEYIELVKSYTFDEVIKLANKIYDWEKANIVLVTKDPAIEVELKVKDLWSKLTAV